MMKLNMPDNEGQKAIVKNGNTLTFILGRENRIFWHQKDANGLETKDLNETSYGKTLRQLIIDKRNSAITKENFTVIIRPSNGSNYKNTVDVLDEMTITKQVRYAIADISAKEAGMCEAKIK